jgi:NAD(P)H-dependent flavin oxidoreductase YrpB (nitropropane dioxygenase family)
LKTHFVTTWLVHEIETQDSQPDGPFVGSTVIAGGPMPIQRFTSIPPSADATGDIDSMSLLAGQSVGLVDQIQPAADIVREVVNGAEQVIREVSTLIVAS